MKILNKHTIYRNCKMYRGTHKGHTFILTNGTYNIRYTCKS